MNCPNMLLKKQACRLAEPDATRIKSIAENLALIEELESDIRELMFLIQMSSSPVTMLPTVRRDWAA